MGPVTSKLKKMYDDVVRGKVAEYKHWCQPVYAEQTIAAS
jgi:hypothetical protein